LAGSLYAGLSVIAGAAWCFRSSCPRRKAVRIGYQQSNVRQ
jgi:hypothetical protein